MHSQQMYITTPSQVDHENMNQITKRNSSTSFVINGCVISFSSATKSTDEPIKAVKEILLSVYRTRVAKS